MCFQKIFHRNRNTGLIPQPIDERDYLYTPEKVSGEVLTTGVDLRDKFPTATYQNGYNSCSYHAICALLDYNLKYKKQFTSWEMNTSEAFLWYYGRLRMGTQTQNAGTILRDGFKVIKQWGFIPENEWTYSNGIYKEPSARAKMMGETFKLYLAQIKGYYSIIPKFDTTISLIVNALDNELPVVFGMPTDSAYTSVRKANPYVDVVTGSSGYHAQIIVGYKYYNDLLYFIVRNSWGTSWGERGYAYVNSNLIKNVGFDYWTLK
jgi:C1A family cysteine protease